MYSTVWKWILFLIYERFTGILLKPRLSNPAWQASNVYSNHVFTWPEDVYIYIYIYIYIYYTHIYIYTSIYIYIYYGGHAALRDRRAEVRHEPARGAAGLAGLLLWLVLAIHVVHTCVCIYIYIYIYTHYNLSLSLYIYIYIYIHIDM